MPVSSKIDIRDAILDAANRRLARSGYKKMTIDELAADVGIGKGTVYLHFPSKEEVALSLVAVTAVAGQGQTPRPEVVQLVEAFIATVNGPDSGVDKFVKEHFTADYQKARSADERRKWFQTIRAKYGTVTLAGLRRTAPDTFTIVMSSEKGDQTEFEVIHDDKVKISSLNHNESSDK